MNKALLEITSCAQCPYWMQGGRQSTDGFDEGFDWICTKAERTIAGFVERHEVKTVKIPDWCPILSPLQS